MEELVKMTRYAPRKGSHRGSENALLMNHYDCDLVRDGQKWRFKCITVDNAWAQGDPEIINALATHRVLTLKPTPPK
jgi:hypothetical protein